MEDKQKTTGTTTSPAKTNEVVTYKSRNELTLDEINALPRVNIKVVKQTIKSTGANVYNLFHTLITNKPQKDEKGVDRIDTNGNVMYETITVQYTGRDFTATKFELFKENRNLTTGTEFIVRAPFRAIKGKTLEGREYFVYELFLGGRMIISDFYTADDVELLLRRKGIKDIKFITNNNIKSLEDVTTDLYTEMPVISSDIL